ncbi:hypothetical protein HDU98_009544 [Podochytrium sp. JEL0797]|nr:hypothetical protein HDU98_009544 [Podochytrium sp. JEL0797]
MQSTKDEDIDALSAATIWASMSREELINAHPNWARWTPPASNPPAATKALMDKMGVTKTGGFGNLEKCVVEPEEARGLAKALAESNASQDLDHASTNFGFWLLPTLKARSETKIFSCTDRCAEAGTSIVIPEHRVGYPAMKGSIVTVKKGEFYGVGVLNTAIFDLHVKKGLACCTNQLVLLRSEKRPPSNVNANSSEMELAQAIGKISFPPVLPNKRHLGPGSFLDIKREGLLGKSGMSSAGSTGSRMSVDKRSTLLAQNKATKKFAQ